MSERIERALRREPFGRAQGGRLLEPGMRVAVACSGGADSVALVCLLEELRGPLGLRLLVVHLNHQLRGAEADADEAFVRQLAERLELEFLVRRQDVAARAQKEKSNLEEAGRLARLDFFASLIRNGKADAVALAHTLDDQAETVLARLLRGAGTRGLAGIYPVVEPVPGAQAGRLVRPFLGIRRADLRAYLAEREQPWREDTSNLDRRRLRNRLRLDLLPQLDPAAIAHLGRLAERAREEESFWSAYIEEKFAALVDSAVDDPAARLARRSPLAEGGPLEFQISNLLTPDPFLERLPARRAAEAQRALARRLLRRALAEVRGDLRRITQTHVESLLRLADPSGQSGRRVVLPGVEVERRFDRLLFHPVQPPDGAERQQGVSPQPAPGAAPADYRLHVEAPGGVPLPGGGILLFKLISLAEGKPGYNESRKLVDAARAPFPLVVRNWHPGDAYQPRGAARVKKLKTLFREQRVPRQQRARTAVVLREGEIVCVPRFGVAAPFGLSDASGTALLIEEKG
ncbi:MAG: tRNA lysidine(34) synthetase TilS [Terriglobia bacterium]